jgi:acetyl esterase/lipase
VRGLFRFFLLFAWSVLALAADQRTPTQEGIVYGVADGQSLTMDYYAPKGPEPHPVAIIIHGGGYQRGNSKSGSEAFPALHPSSEAAGDPMAMPGSRLFRPYGTSI